MYIETASGRKSWIRIPSESLARTASLHRKTLKMFGADFAWEFYGKVWIGEPKTPKPLRFSQKTHPLDQTFS